MVAPLYALDRGDTIPSSSEQSSLAWVLRGQDRNTNKWSQEVADLVRLASKLHITTHCGRSPTEWSLHNLPERVLGSGRLHDGSSKENGVVSVQLDVLGEIVAANPTVIVGETVMRDGGSSSDVV